MATNTAQATVTTVEMSLSKVTKNTYKFESNDLTAPIPTLYVAQSAFAQEPTTIKVTVEV